MVHKILLESLKPKVEYFSFKVVYKGKKIVSNTIQHKTLLKQHLEQFENDKIYQIIILTKQLGDYEYLHEVQDLYIANLRDEMILLEQKTSILGRKQCIPINDLYILGPTSKKVIVIDTTLRLHHVHMHCKFDKLCSSNMDIDKDIYKLQHDISKPMDVDASIKKALGQYIYRIDATQSSPMLSSVYHLVEVTILREKTWKEKLLGWFRDD
jgi:hypothetical protein